MAFKINGEELEKLVRDEMSSELSHEAKLTYLLAIRPHMDFQTCIVGIKRRVSYQSIIETLEFSPGPGSHRKEKRYNRESVRAILRELERAGLIEWIKSDSKGLIFRCLLADGVNAAETRNNPRTTPSSNNKNNIIRFTKTYESKADSYNEEISSNPSSNQSDIPRNNTPLDIRKINISPYGDMFGATPNRAKQVQQKSRQQRDTAREVLAFLNERAGRGFPETEANIGLIVARLREGYSADQLRQVVVRKTRQWGGDAKMAQYLRPKTLFGRTNFANYVGELVTGNAGKRQG